MKALVIIFFVFECLDALVALCQLAADNYPRIETRGVGFDTAKLVVSIGFALWAAAVIWG